MKFFPKTYTNNGKLYIDTTEYCRYEINNYEECRVWSFFEKYSFVLGFEPKIISSYEYYNIDYSFYRGRCYIRGIIILGVMIGISRIATWNPVE
jgi:hypothetical protein